MFKVCIPRNESAFPESFLPIEKLGRQVPEIRVRRRAWRGLHRRCRKVSHVQQMELADCGAASLAMAFQYHGMPLGLAEVREIMGSSRDGVTASSIAKTARYLGMTAQGVRVSAERAQTLPVASILFWESRHFVVLERISRRGITILDPALGRRVVSRSEFDEAFSGIAIVLEPNMKSDCQRQAARPKSRKEGFPFFSLLRDHKQLVLPVLAMSVLLQVCLLAVPLLTGRMIDRVLPRGDSSALLVLVAAVTLLVLFYFMVSMLRARVLTRLKMKLEVTMTRSFVDHLVRLPYPFFQRRSVGDVMMRVNSNSIIREILTTGTVATILDGSLGAVYLIFIFAQSPRMGIVVSTLAFLQIILLLGAGRRYRNLMAQNLQAQARSQSYLVQVVTGMESLKSAGAEKRAAEEWFGRFSTEANISFQRGLLSGFVESLLSALRLGSPLVVTVIGGWDVMAGQLTLGSMLALSALCVAFMQPVTSLVGTGLQLQLMKGYVERINDVLQSPTEKSEKPDPAGRSLTGQITLDRVAFRHSVFSSDVVQNISIDIDAGSTVALVGGSGSGKSTLVRLLLGLYLPTAGRILYDGLNVDELSLQDIREQIGIVPQQSFLFAASIKDNLSLSTPGCKPEDIEYAARLACIHSDVLAMPMGYETVLSDGGSSLSGGQRQRVALARALLPRPRVLVLDEATSALDSVTEAQIFENLQQVSATKIIVAHRLSTIAMADEIVVMEDGHVVERGSHNELLAAQGSYWRLVEAQSRIVGGPRNTHVEPVVAAAAGMTDFSSGPEVDAAILGVGEMFR